MSTDFTNVRARVKGDSCFTVNNATVPNNQKFLCKLTGYVLERIDTNGWNMSDLKIVYANGFAPGFGSDDD